MTHEPARLSLTAVALILAAAACFTAIDTVVKYLALRYPVPVLVLIRWSVPALLMVALFGPKMRWGLLRTARANLHWIRGTVLLLSSVCSFAALKFLPLADATALNYSTPILVTLMAGWVLRERITRYRWMFVAAGFVGTLLIAHPGNAMPTAAWLAALGAAVLSAAFQILTRKLAGDDLLVLIFYPSLVGALLALPAAVPFIVLDEAYRSLDPLLFVGIGAIGLIGHFLYIQAFQRAPASAIAPFTYMQLVWSTLSGWLIFGTLPDHWTIAGMITIAGSGVALTWYERGWPSLSPAGPAALASQQPPMMLGLDLTGLAAGASHLAVGQTMLIRDAGGPPKTVIRTD